MGIDISESYKIIEDMATDNTTIQMGKYIKGNGRKK